jgi:hypothetical protein
LAAHLDDHGELRRDAEALDKAEHDGRLRLDLAARGNRRLDRRLDLRLDLDENVRVDLVLLDDVCGCRTELSFWC